MADAGQAPQTPPPQVWDVSTLLELGDEVHNMLSCYHYSYLTQRRKLVKIEECKLKLREFREFLCAVPRQQLSSDEMCLFTLAADCFENLRIQQQQMEDTLYGDPERIHRYPPIQPLNFEGDSTISEENTSLSRSAPSASPSETAVTFLESPVNENVNFDTGFLDRTLPLLVLDSEVLGEEIVGTEASCCCARASIGLGINIATTTEDVKSEEIGNTSHRNKRKFDDI